MDYSTTNTSRTRLEYNACGFKHSFNVRHGLATSYGMDDIQDGLVDGFLAALGTLLPSDFGFTKNEWTKFGEVISIPQPLPSTAALTLGGTASRSRAGNFLSFQGKSSLGSRCSLTVYGIQLVAEDGEVTENFRIEGSEMAAVANAVSLLNNTPFTGIDLGTLTWYNYANFGINAHYQRKLRG